MSAKPKTNTKQLWIKLVIIGALLAVVAWLTKSDMTVIDETIFHAVYGLPAIFGLASYFLTQTATYYVVLIISAALFLVGQKQVSIQIFLKSSLALALALLIKEILERPRPNVLFDDIVVRFEQTASYGFPSAHTALAVAVALGLLPFVQAKYHTVIWFWVVMIALSRIYLGVHTPFDVIGGVLVGLIASLCIQIVTNITAQKNHSAYAKSRK